MTNLLSSNLQGEYLLPTMTALGAPAAGLATPAEAGAFREALDSAQRRREPRVDDADEAHDAQASDDAHEADAADEAGATEQSKSSDDEAASDRTDDTATAEERPDAADAGSAPQVTVEPEALQLWAEASNIDPDVAAAAAASLDGDRTTFRTTSTTSVSTADTAGADGPRLVPTGDRAADRSGGPDGLPSAATPVDTAVATAGDAAAASAGRNGEPSSNAPSSPSGPAAATAPGGPATPTGPTAPAGNLEAADADVVARATTRSDQDAARTPAPTAGGTDSAYRQALQDRVSGQGDSPAEREAARRDAGLERARQAASGNESSNGRAASSSSSSTGAAAATVAIAGGARTTSSTSAASGAATNAAPLGASSAAASATAAPAATTSSASPGVATTAGLTSAPNAASGASTAAPGAGFALPAEADAVAQQAIRGMGLMLGRRGGSMTMRLNPGDLGDLKIRMQIDQGRVTAEFTATTGAARDHLGGQLETLRTALEARGLQVESLTVAATAGADEAFATGDSAANRQTRSASETSAEPMWTGDETPNGSEGDAANGESRGRGDESAEDRPPDRGFTASTAEALRAFARIFGEQFS